MPRSDSEDAAAPGPSALVARMEEELRVRGYSPRTLESYLWHVRRFLEVTDARDPPPGEDDVRAYLLHMLEERGLSHSYVNQCIAALSGMSRRDVG